MLSSVAVGELVQEQVLVSATAAHQESTLRCETPPKMKESEASAGPGSADTDATEVWSTLMLQDSFCHPNRLALLSREKVRSHVHPEGFIGKDFYIDLIYLSALCPISDQSPHLVLLRCLCVLRVPQGVSAAAHVDSPPQVSQPG